MRLRASGQGRGSDLQEREAVAWCCHLVAEYLSTWTQWGAKCRPECPFSCTDMGNRSAGFTVNVHQSFHFGSTMQKWAPPFSHPVLLPGQSLPGEARVPVPRLSPVTQRVATLHPNALAGPWREQRSRDSGKDYPLSPVSTDSWARGHLTCFPYDLSEATPSPPFPAPRDVTLWRVVTCLL